MNIKKLFDELYKKLKSMNGIERIYVGKTKDIQASSIRHKRDDGLCYTDEIAYGEIDIINDGEKYLVCQFLNSDLPCVNKRGGGGGPEGADKLYIAYSCSPKMESINELNDEDFGWIPVRLIK